MDEFKRYKERVSSYKIWKEKLKLKEVKAGDKIDIRDTEYIWCVGVVELKITSEKHKTVLYIHYEVSIILFTVKGWNRKYDEYVYLTSPRLAPLGTYSNRTDIPRYYMCPHSNMMFAQIMENGAQQQ